MRYRSINDINYHISKAAICIAAVALNTFYYSQMLMSLGAKSSKFREFLRICLRYKKILISIKYKNWARYVKSNVRNSMGQQWTEKEDINIKVQFLNNKEIINWLYS